jgi:hypothetical protein
MKNNVMAVRDFSYRSEFAIKQAAIFLWGLDAGLSSQGAWFYPELFHLRSMVEIWNVILYEFLRFSLLINSRPSLHVYTSPPPGQPAYYHVLPLQAVEPHLRPVTRLVNFN